MVRYFLKDRRYVALCCATVRFATLEIFVNNGLPTVEIGPVTVLSNGIEIVSLASSVSKRPLIMERSIAVYKLL